MRHHGTGFKTFNHPVVGEMTLAYEGMAMESEPGLSITIYAAEPGSPSAERMQLLANLGATPEAGIEPRAVQGSPARQDPSPPRS